MAVSPPAKLCGDPSLDEDDFCVPDASVVELVRTAQLTVRNVQPASAGTTGIKKLRLEVDHPERGRLLFYVKWRAAPKGGEGFNNDPRKELAAYEAQRLMFPNDQAVVPPTVARCFDLDEYGGNLQETEPTFAGTNCVLGVMSLWLEGVEAGKDKLFDKERLREDRAYRTTIANLNVFAMVINHGDSHWNNLLISTEDPPRAFIVDSGLAFSGLANPKVHFGIGDDEDWSELVVDSLPKSTVTHLKALDPSVFDKLATVAEFANWKRQLVPVEPGASLDPNEGVRVDAARVQLGLTNKEIQGVKTRLARLLERVDTGKIAVY